MDNNSSANSGGLTIGVGIPSVVIGVLIALKKIGMTSMSYWDIIWFGVDVFIVCALIGFCIWLVIIFLVMLFTKF